MIKAVLLDLDNTLLLNPDRPFVTAYLEQIDTYFKAQWGLEDAAGAMRTAVRRMNEPGYGPQTNYHLMIETLAQVAKRDFSETLIALNQFYATAYTALRNCIQPVAGAARLVNDLLSRDYAVVIATNPLQPKAAIQQRMAWAGLPTDFDTYAFVTHAENMHFTKPNPAYYAEILARVGVEPDESVMIGDRAEGDIAPANLIGIHTFHVLEGATPAPAADAGGSLGDFYNRVMADGWFSELYQKPLQPAMILPQLTGNIGALYGLLDTVQPHFWQQHPNPKEWSILQILCHLAESERTAQHPRLRRIHTEDKPFLAETPPPPGPDQLRCEGDGETYIGQFVAARRETLDFLAGLQAADWQRTARHSIFGPTTLLEMAYFTAQHDRLHINQLCQTIGNCT